MEPLALAAILFLIRVKSEFGVLLFDVVVVLLMALLLLELDCFMLKDENDLGILNAGLFDEEVCPPLFVSEFMSLAADTYMELAVLARDWLVFADVIDVDDVDFRVGTFRCVEAALMADETLPDTA